jgi:CRP-like cAMP-binding protein
MRAQEVGRLGPTMYFGELALLHSAPRAASVVAHSDCDLLELGRADFMELMGPLAKTLEAQAVRYGLNSSAKRARSSWPL